MHLEESPDLENIVLNAPIGICLLDAITLVSEIVNNKFIEVAGKPYESIIGKHYWETFAEAKQYYTASLDSVIKTGEPFYADEVELMLIRHGKEEMVFVTFVYAPVKNKDGLVKKVAVWVLENTAQVNSRNRLENVNKELALSNQELKKSQSRLNGIFQQATAGIMICNGPGLVIELINDVMLQIIGRNADIKGKPFRDVLPELRSQGLFDVLENVYNTGKPFIANEAKVGVDKNGILTDGYYSFSCQTINNTDDITAGILIVANDVTEQVRNRLEAERVGKQLQLAVEAGRIGTWNIQPTTKKLEYNDMLAQIFGYEGPEKMTYDKAIGQVAEAYRNIILKEIEEAIADGGDYDITYAQHRFNDNKLIWLRSLGKITRHESGAHSLFSGVVLDISDQVKAREAELRSMDELSAINEEIEASNEELLASNLELAAIQRQLEESLASLTESEERFRTMAEGSGILIAVGDETSNAVYFSNAWVQLTGRSMEELLEFGWVDLVHPDDRERYVNLYLDAFKDRVSFTGEFRILNKQGEYRWLLANGPPRFHTDGSFAGYISSCIDITDQLTIREQLKDSEERLLLLADNMSQLAWMTDETGYIFWYNKRWYDYTGTTLDEMQGWGWDKVQHPDHLDRVVKKWTENINSGEIFELTFPLRSKEGEFRWFLTRAVPLKDQNGAILRWFGTNTDINEQMRDEQRKNDFIGMVSHELKTPLTSLTALVQVTNAKLKNSEDKFLAGAMAKADIQVKKMSKMINGFLDVSRLESGKIHIERERFDMKDLVREIEEEVVPTTTSHHIIFDPVLTSWVNGDRDKIGQVITNFISNALKYSSPGTTVQIVCVTANGAAKVSVRDEGMGIAAKDIEKLFDRYYRVEGHQMKSISGFGIGLYLCSEIIERHNGKIWVESEVGKGSTFYFSIPVAN